LTNRLSKEEQDIIVVEVRKSTPYQRKVSRDAQGQTLANLKKRMEVNEVPPAEITTIRAKLTRVTDKYSAEVGPDLLNQLYAEIDAGGSRAAVTAPHTPDVPQNEVCMISGKSTLVAHIGYPTESFKASYIYNPWFDKAGIDAAVIPMGVKAKDYPDVLKALFRLTNLRGALVTMPHKVTTVGLVDECTTTVKIAGSCNAILKRRDGTLLGDMFDGTGFTRGLRRKGFVFEGARCLVVGTGGVGSAIAASLAADGVASISLFDVNKASAEGLAGRLRTHYPRLDVRAASNDPAGYDLVVNATPLGMKPIDPLPFDVMQLAPETFVGEVVMKQEMTPLLRAAQEKGCRFVVGTDMLFEMIPAYLEFFGFGTTTPDELRVVAKLAY
jgi:shikimate dehydrogenase